jgi:hypothetical protein
MSRAGVDAVFFQDSLSHRSSEMNDASQQTVVGLRDRNAPPSHDVRGGPRRTPRKSVIVVLPDNHVLSPELVTDSLPGEEVDEIVDVILACAGPPLGISGLQRKVRHLQILLAPAGTSTEDLRELAMGQAPGDIVTLLSGIPVRR